ncbi:MAG: BACON domain-containing protein [Bacteroidaceae bacterium]|nr:BACON domain-containing protein [Bacteroidaceae bacterium]
MKYYFTSFLTLLLMLTVVGCSSDLLPFLQFEVESTTGKSEIALTVDGTCDNAAPIRIKASDELEWTVKPSVGWLHVNPTSGHGTTSIAVSADRSPDFVERSANITVDCEGMQKLFVVRQAPATQMQLSYGENLNKSSLTLTPLSAAQQYEVKVHSNESWTAAVNEGHEWCSISPSAGQNDGTLMIQVTENRDTKERNASIVLTAGAVSATISVVQGAYNASLVITPMELKFKDRDKDPQKVTVSSSDPVTISCDSSSWCIVSTDNLEAGDGRVFYVSVKENATLQDRPAKITVENKYDTQIITVIQDKHEPYIELSNERWDFDEGSDAHDFTIKTDDEWEAISGASDWCRIQNPTGDGDGLLAVFVLRNETESDRETDVTVKLKKYAVTKKIHITQAKHTATLKLTPASLSAYNSSENNTSVSIETTDYWEAVSDASWCTVTPPSGTGNGTMQIKVGANRTTSSRTATITVKTYASEEKKVVYKTATLNVKQEAFTAELSIADADKSISVTEGGTNNRPVNVSSTISWTTKSNAGWCTVTPSNGEGNGQITISVEKNIDTNARTAEVTLTNSEYKKMVSISVTQAGHVAKLTLSPTSLPDFNSTQGSVQVSVTTDDYWEAISSQTWCTLSPLSGTGSGTLQINVDANSQTSQRTATVTVKTYASSDKQTPYETKTITVKQEAFKAELSVEKTTMSFEEDGGSSPINISSTVDWKAVSDQSWCSVEPSNGEGNGQLVIKVEKNASVSERTAKVTLRNVAYNLTAIITVKQAGHDAILEVSADALSFDMKDTKAEVVTITTNGDDKWTASVSEEWCKVAPAYGSGKGAISVTVDENKTSKDRTAIVTVTLNDYPDKTKEITVTQSMHKTTLEIDPQSFTVEANGGTQRITVTCSDDWVVTTASSWCTFSKNEGKAGTDFFDITVGEYANGFRERTASIKIQAKSSDGTLLSATRYVNITQKTKEAPTPQEGDNGFPDYVRRRKK